ncbi:MAG: hypothetical protein N2422_05310 [Rhodobacteraceae bacterium]|nr:hypothetical protein [Paracoccaceae bacterium]
MIPQGRSGRRDGPGEGQGRVRGRFARLRGAGLLGLTLSLAVAGSLALAQAPAPSALADTLMRQAIQAIDGGDYRRATQLLTRLVGLPVNTQTARAQELLGNVREANGQLAHAKAEYEIFLQKFPDSEGAPRVRARLDAILSGATPLPPSPPPATVAGTAAPRRAGSFRPTAAAPPAPAGPTVRDQGVLTLTYRFNEGATEITNLEPDPDETEEEDDIFRNALTAGLQFSRTIDSADRRVRLTFAGLGDIDFSDSSESDFRLSEAKISVEDKASGRVVTFGRQRLDPQGIAYRVDGVSLKLPLDGGTVLGFVLGTAVDSSRDDFFGDDRILLGASATFEKALADGDVTLYAALQRDGSFTYREALGAEYRLELGKASLYANAEYDLKFGEVNRLLLTGAQVLDSGARVTGRLAYYRSPSLNLQNALIGQGTDDLDDLLATFTREEIEALAVDRSATVTTLGATYYGKLNGTWDLALDGTLYESSGTPASGGVDAVDGGGLRAYLGARVIGSSVFMADDQVSLGLRYSHGDDDNLYVLETSMRAPLNERLNIQPRLRLGYRDFTDGPGNETFVMPSVNARYRIDRTLSLQVDAGARWSSEETPLLVEKQSEFFLTAGIAKSF